MSEENKAVFRRWFEEVWNRGRAEAIDEMFAADGVAHGLAGADGAELRGPADFRAFHGNFRTAFPDIEVTVEDVIAEGDKVAGRCSARATHRADSLGFAATDRGVEFEGMCIARIRDGQIVEAWNTFDFLTMYRQLGLLDLDAARARPLPAED
ncbi:MAG TPA: ester cyclase [Pyrinomonadaceae bacterium]|nr:ester cyclase [Pyrinomonadaceae bacterium]